MPQMKYFVLLFSIFFLTACHSQMGPKNTQTSHKKVSTASVGEPCGEEIKCEAGLECRYDAMNFKAGGKCVDTVVDKKVKCDQNKIPVCGVVGRLKNAYLNRCEADRHGADVLNEWLCKLDEDVPGSCEAKALGVWNCEKLFIAYEFDGTKCVQANVVGCEAEIPFDSLEACQAKCE